MTCNKEGAILYRVWGCPTKSSFEISEELTKLKVPHTARIENRFVAVPGERALQAHLTDNPKRLKRGVVNFVVASYAELSLTNYPMLVTVKNALAQDSGIDPVVVRMTAMDYVAAISKPSVITKIQTAIYKIQPYSLRKSTQNLVLGFFNSQVSDRELAKVLGRSYKTMPVLELVKEGSKLREAVQELKTKTPEQVEAETGIPAFELRYVSKERP